MIGSETIGSYLDRLASHDPTPGGGAAGAVHAAQAAALIGMVARFTTGKRYVSYEQEVTEIRQSADDQAHAALQLADADESAFQQVIAAYRLPKGSAEEATQQVSGHPGGAGRRRGASAASGRGRGRRSSGWVSGWSNSAIRTSSATWRPRPRPRARPPPRRG